MPKAVTSKSKTPSRAPTKTAAAKGRPKKAARPNLSSEERTRMIQYAAYHIAEKDGFQAGKEQDYWLQAERQIRDLFPDAVEDLENATNSH